MASRRFLDWSFGHYLKIAHPSFARGERPVSAAPPLAKAA
jgi:hypothetical protein